MAEELLAGVMTAAPVGAQNGKEEGLAPSLALTQGSFFDEKGKWGLAKKSVPNPRKQHECAHRSHASRMSRRMHKSPAHGAWNPNLKVGDTKIH